MANEMNEKTQNYENLHQERTNQSALERIKSAGLLTISPELFEKLYLQPQVPVKGELRSIVGNPTPLYVFNDDIWSGH